MEAEPTWTEQFNERMERLERENRRWKWISAVVFIGALVGLVEASPLVRSPQTVAAGEFVIKDKHGDVRARFGLDRNGLPQLVMLDREGRDQFRVYGEADESVALAMHDRGKLRLMMNAPTDGSSSLMMLDNTQRTAATMFLHGPGKAGVALNNSEESVMLRTDPRSGAELSWHDATGQPRSHLTVDNATPTPPPIGKQVNSSLSIEPAFSAPIDDLRVTPPDTDPVTADTMTSLDTTALRTDVFSAYRPSILER